jgi:ABC-type dipeptide/oligopeptide/nickel transport system permease component
VSFRRFFLVRLGWALGALAIAVSLAFLMFHVWARYPRCERQSVSNCGFDELATYYDHGHAIPVRFERYLRNFFSDGSMGESIITGRDARSFSLNAIPPTGAVVLFGLTLALVLALLVATPWSRTGDRRRSVWRAPSYLGASLLPSSVALLLSYAFAHKLGWFSTGRYCDFFDPPREAMGCGGAVDWAKGLVLPCFTFALFFAAVYTRILRVLLKDVLTAKAEDRGRLARRSKLVMARILGRDIGFAIGAAVFVEGAFGIPGLGFDVVQGAEFDAPIAETALLYASLIAITVHFLVDVIVGALDSDLRAEWPVAGMPKPA